MSDPNAHRQEDASASGARGVDAAADPGGGPGESWRSAVRGNVLMMGLVSLFTDFSSEMMNPLLPIYILGLVAPGAGAVGRAALFVGLMEGVAETAASLLKVFSGRLSDRLGRRKALVVAGYGLSSIARPAMAAAGAIWHVIALKLADRVGKGVRTSPRDALIGDSVGPEHRGLAFSFHRIMDHTGAILGPIVAVAVLYAFLGQVLWRGGTDQPGADQMRALRWLFAIALIPGLCAMAALVLKVREIAPKPSAPGAGTQAGRGAWRLLPRRFYAFVGVVTLFALGNSSDLFIVFLGRERFGLGLLQLVGLWVALHASKIVFSIPGGVLSDRLGRRPVIVAGWVVYAVVYLGLAFCGVAWQFWALVIAYGFYHGMTEGVEKALVADFVPSERRGTAYGIYHGAVGLAALPASLLFGVFWELIGPRVAFGIGAALAGAAAVLLIVLLSAASLRAADAPAGARA
ncbi:MAG TPA: MFS transporter [Phycisphaerae bacterium]|nr:MFS transporter [Phycisphaerae bacterium]